MLLLLLLLFIRVARALVAALNVVTGPKMRDKPCVNRDIKRR